MKAQSIDRLALTRQKFGAKMYGDSSDRIPYEKPVVVDAPQHREGYSKCPSCGQVTLIHEDGCMHCRSCGWSACG